LQVPQHCCPRQLSIWQQTVRNLFDATQRSHHCLPTRPTEAIPVGYSGSNCLNSANLTNSNLYLMIQWTAPHQLLGRRHFCNGRYTESFGGLQMFQQHCSKRGYVLHSWLWCNISRRDPQSSSGTSPSATMVMVTSTPARLHGFLKVTFWYLPWHLRGYEPSALIEPSY